MAMLAVAATIYFFRLGQAGFDDAEAYSAYIASRTSVAAVLDASLQLDPGKGGGLYVFLLHWYCEVFGTGEAALRAFSATFALASVVLVYALAADLFSADIALLAAALWAFNPIALIVARWARMYSMFIALTIASLLAMRKVQRGPTIFRVATFGVLGAAMLYTHLGSALMLAAEAAILARDRWRGRAIAPTCAGLALAMVMFVPIAPAAFAQVRASALGHRFDWIGSAHQMPLAIKLIAALAAAVSTMLIVFGPPMAFDRAEGTPRNSEPFRWCAIWSLLPLMALAAGSLILHPKFEIRYIAPVVAGFAIMMAAVLERAANRIRNLITVAIVAAFLTGAILFNLYHRPFDLWQRIAHAVAAGGAPSEEVFFEAGYVMGLRKAAGANPESLVEVLPRGYLRIPFDYYFTGPNPRRAINPFRDTTARDAVAESARRDGGAWLVSHMSDDDVACELPSRAEFVCDRIIYDESVSVSLYHIIPRGDAR